MKPNILSTTLILGILCLGLIFSSCKKYEEGPGLSLRSKKERIANTWKFEAMYYNGEKQDLDDNAKAARMTFTKDGKYTDSWGESGTWTLINNDETLRLTSDGEHEDYTIIKLKENALWLRMTDGTDKMEIHLIPG